MFILKCKTGFGLHVRDRISTGSSSAKTSVWFTSSVVLGRTQKCDFDSAFFYLVDL